MKLKDRLIDAWVVKNDGSEEHIEIEVPEEIMVQGHDAIVDHLDHHARAHIGSVVSEVKFTQTW
jgi:hypothetical protein